jgi:hypothetical protein
MRTKNTVERRKPCKRNTRSIGSPNTGADTGQVISPEEPEVQTSALVVELLKDVVVPVAIAVITK